MQAPFCFTDPDADNHRSFGFFVLSLHVSNTLAGSGIGRWLQTSGRWSVVLKSRIWSYPGGDKYSFVDDVCPQYLHCTDEDQQSETARLSTVVSNTVTVNMIATLETHLNSFRRTSLPLSSTLQTACKPKCSKQLQIQSPKNSFTLCKGNCKQRRTCSGFEINW